MLLSVKVGESAWTSGRQIALQPSKSERHEEGSLCYKVHQTVDLPMPFNPLEYALCLQLPRHFNAISWQEHIPFAMAVIQMVRPKVLVELGVHTGDSYLAFCQGIAELGLETACYGVDTWRGDEHAGFFGDEVLAELRLHHDAQYGTFSRLVQSTFDEAARQMPDGSVSLLHVDGLHTYEAAKHDWETWKPKLTSDGIVLFHDINVRERDFGVWKLWSEIKEGRPHFEFQHGHGLGVLAAGQEAPAGIRELFELTGDSAAAVRAFFFALGNRITLQKPAEELGEARRKVLEYDRECRLRDVRIREHEAKLLEYDSAVRDRNATIQRLSDEVAQLQTDLARAASQLAGRSYRIGRAITAPWRLLRGSRS